MPNPTTYRRVIATQKSNTLTPFDVFGVDSEFYFHPILPRDNANLGYNGVGRFDLKTANTVYGVLDHTQYNVEKALIKTFDFSVDEDTLTASFLTFLGGQTIAGETDCLKISLSYAGSTNQRFVIPITGAGQTFKITGRYFIESTNVKVDGFSAGIGGTGETPYYNEIGVWREFVCYANKVSGYNLLDGFEHNFSSLGITDWMAIVDLKLYEMATETNIHQVYNAGAVTGPYINAVNGWMDFDGVDDYLIIQYLHLLEGGIRFAIKFIDNDGDGTNRDILQLHRINRIVITLTSSNIFRIDWLVGATPYQYDGVVAFLDNGLERKVLFDYEDAGKEIKIYVDGSLHETIACADAVMLTNFASVPSYLCRSTDYANYWDVSIKKFLFIDRILSEEDLNYLNNTW
tara:strand:+ start:2884 stop:4092 length:1209 start_codon:yes stop_codon:yes gene_type:complete